MIRGNFVGSLWAAPPRHVHFRLPPLPYFWTDLQLLLPFLLLLFLVSATPSPCGLSPSSTARSRWVEAVFSLVWAVVSVQHGAAAMTECGLIPALLNVVQLNMDGQVGGGER